ncbi:acetylornithine aminotransferase [Brachybacterium phenoliresistens]|uniref:Acetylornithine aminotransferase n=1 Tax=Brachybacterium phenoliresistens TaxID=396014 RepID=Z9JWU7_9MICO|nr:acetylornithine transaminase [Brachybacterium phenoliresistens]EWS82276.1 acetylornithine aminotransferase [Brachybacterium phenoliresistens]
MSEQSTAPEQGAPSAQGAPSEPGAATSGTGIADRYREAMIPVFGTPQRVLVRGEGVHVWDDEGRQYLDLLGGIAVNALGHGHPALVSAITKQAETLAHVSNVFASAPQVELAEKLLRLADAPDGSGVFFANSGAEANEAAFKIARRTGRPRIIALENAFHGRTLGALALTHKEAYRAPFAPLPGGVEWLPAGDVEALRTALAPGDVAAVFAEPIQGEAGVRPLGADYLRALRELTREAGTLLVLDEIQTGIGRTGRWFAHQGVPGVVPDVMTLAKGLGGGFPIGAAIAFGPEVRGLLTAGQHGTTFGGNPLGAATALAVLGTIEEEGLLEHVRATGEALVRGIDALEDPRILGVRGEGLLRGVMLAEPLAPQVLQAALEAGFIINAPEPTTLRLAPPLIITAEELGTFVAALPALLDRAAQLAGAEEGN